MTTNTFRGLLVATAATLILAVSGAHAADAPAPKLSAAVSKPIQAAQKASQTQDWAAMKAALDEAGKVSTRTDYDNYIIARLTMMMDANQQDMAGATVAVQAAADSPAMPDGDKAAIYKLASQLSLQAKQYDKALAYAKSLEALNVTDAASLAVIAQAYYFTKDYTSAVAAGQKGVAAATAAGKKPERAALEMLMSSQVGLKDETGAGKTLEIMVMDYNDPGDWQMLIDDALATKGLRDVDAIWLGRLALVSGATISPSDATLFGSTASHLTFFGDAQTAQQKGGTGFPDPGPAATKDKQSIAAQIAAGQKANGQYNVKLAEALYGYGMYPEAEAAARLSMTKPGATDSSEAPMVLGQALVAQGKYDDAVAAFGQVTGGGPATPRIARLWVDYITIKKAPPAAAAAAK